MKIPITISKVFINGSKIGFINSKKEHFIIFKAMYPIKGKTNKLLKKIENAVPINQ